MYQFFNALKGLVGADWLYLFEETFEKSFSPYRFEVGVAELLSNHKGEKLIVVAVFQFNPVEVCGHEC